MAAIGGANDQFFVAFTALSRSAETRSSFVNNVVAFIEENSLSGIDIDWEFPTADNRNNFVLILQLLRRSFDVSGYVLSIATAPDKWRADEFYDIPRISQEVDFINLMTYDLRGAWDSCIGHHAQLYPHHTDSSYRRELNVAASVTYWLSNGAPADKIILGIPTYGNTLILADVKQHKIGSEINANRTNESQKNISYDEYCTMKSHGWKQFYDTNYSVYYAVNDFTWFGFDSVQQVIRKSKFIKRHGLGGVMFWSIDTDDYNNDCLQGQFPLINSALTELSIDT